MNQQNLQHFEKSMAVEVLISARCPVCGLRVSGENPTCVDHGPINADLPEGETLPRVLPQFPGYSTTRLLGRGGFSTVYLAEREMVYERVAIKMARKTRLDACLRLLHEAKVLCAIGPPHVPMVYHVDKMKDELPYIVMEWVSAPTLAMHLVKTGGPIAPEKACKVALSLLCTLELIHLIGFLRLDLKPENILVGDDLHVTLIDFGLATRILDNDTNGHPKDEVIGTDEYMAPEQCTEDGELDVRTDIYALGVILYEMFAGRPPFWGPSAVVRQNHQSLRPPRLSTLIRVPSSVEKVVHRCLAKDPEERFASVTALREAFETSIANGAWKEPSRKPSVSPPSSIVVQERRPAGLLFFETDVNAVAVRRRLLLSGCELAYASGQRCVALYSHEAGDSPATRAFATAQELKSEGVCSRILVDLASVNVQLRSRRFLSALFWKDSSFPTMADPQGIFLTSSAAAALKVSYDASNAHKNWVHWNSIQSSADTSFSKEEEAIFVGQDDILNALLESARATLHDRTPRAACVIGDLGHGKTRLGQELMKRLRLDPSTEPVEIHVYESKGGNERSVREFVRQVLDLPDSIPQDHGRRILVQRLRSQHNGRLWPAVALALGWLNHDASEVRALEAAPFALRSALTLVTGQFLRQKAASTPLLIVLDDAHLADPVVLSALEYAASAAGQLPIWICALGSPAFEQTHKSFGLRAADHQMLHIKPLDPKSASQLCRHLLQPATNVPDSAIQRLIQRTQSIPFLLVELIGELKRAGVIRKLAASGSFYIATDELDAAIDLPVIDWLANRELDRMAPALRAHARLIALLGEGVTVDEVQAILHRLDQQGRAADFPLDSRIGIQKLFAASIIVQDAEHHIRFRNPLVQEAITKSTPEPLRKCIHLAAYEYYLHETSVKEDQRLHAIAFHAARVGLNSMAEKAWMTLAERARRRHLYLDAECGYSRALELAKEPTLAAYRGRGLMRYRLGRYKDALADFEVARAQAEATLNLTVQIEILLDEATALDWMDDYQASEEKVLKAKALSTDQQPTPLLEARLLLGLGRSRHRASREQEAAQVIESAASCAEHLGDEGYETLVISLLMLGFILPGLGRLSDAQRALDRAITLCEAHGDALHLGAAISNRALIKACMGDKADMIQDFNRVISLAEQLGQGVMEVVGHFNLGECLYLMDDIEGAEPWISRAFATEARLRGDTNRPALWILKARLQLYQGHEDTARKIVTQLLKSRHDMAENVKSSSFMAPSDEVLASMIELATRDASDEEWDALEARSVAHSVGQEYIEVLEARVLFLTRRGRTKDAGIQLDKTLAVASKIPNAMGYRLDRLHKEVGNGE